MNLLVIDLKEKIEEYLQKEGIYYTHRLVDMIAIELSAKMEDYEYEKNVTLTCDDKAINSLLSQAVYKSLKRMKGINYMVAELASEDDYSETSDAQIHL